MHADPAPFLNWLYENNRPKYSYLPETTEAWQAWSAGLRQAITAATGLDRLEAMRTPLNSVKLTTEDCGDYTRDLYQILLAPSLFSLTYVLTPKKNAAHDVPEDIKNQTTSGQMPAILACHGHGYGVKAMLGMKPDGKKRQSEPDYHADFAIALVKKGFVVAAPEIIGFGEARRDLDKKGKPDENACHFLSTFLMMFGLTTGGLRVFQAKRNLDLLESLPEVDAARIGTMGISGGGLVASFTAALDDRIKAAVISGYANTFKDSILSVHHCVDNYVPGLLQYCELPDILRLIAPRPCLLENGRKDPIFPIEAAQKAFDAMQAMYALHSAEEKLAADFFDGGHQINGVKAYPWLEKWLL